jgi:hypothetical protein
VIRVLLLCLVAILACSYGRPRTSETATACRGDSLRGVFVLEGSEPGTIPVLRTTQGRIVLDSAPSALLKLSQLEVWVCGTRKPGGLLSVREFRVRGADGLAAWDGMLAETAQSMLLHLPGGSTRTLRGVPPSLKRFVGERVWVTETPDGNVAAYGVIQDPP